MTGIANFGLRILSIPMLTLHTLPHPKGSKRRRKVVGRGNAAGGGTYAGRGLKGQKARTGGRKGLKRKGLRMMLLRIPKKRGFYRPKKNVATVNLGFIELRAQDGMRVDETVLRAWELMPKRVDAVKVLGDGAWTKKSITFIGLSFSAGARAKVEATGSTVSTALRQPKKL